MIRSLCKGLKQYLAVMRLLALTMLLRLMSP
jgi:hypothetical protein